ncbi:MAG: T9SS type A sorting domain-containing protein [Bacteroidales bacterium]|jgi:hypothetical protein|nr:T9SS type A sorting domain-containing protein [Bacteroidales bacterium]
MKKLQLIIFMLGILLASVSSVKAQHFTPVYTGNPYQAMNFVVSAAALDAGNLGAGDEIAVFDVDGGSQICVGSIVLTGPISGNVVFPAATDDPLTPAKDGFTQGNSIIYRYWDNSAGVEIVCVSPTYVPGYNEVYTSLGTAVLSLSGITSPTANAGADGDVCETGSYTLSGSATNYESVNWTTSGDGTFNNANILGATYTPGSGDISSGSVTLTLTANAIAPCTDHATDDIVLTIVDAATANAGPDGNMCSTDTYSLSGSATNYSSVLWSSAGGGTFGNASQLSTTYTPSASEISAGSATLTLTAFGNAPCGNATDQITITIQEGPAANAGSDADICEGSSHTLSGSATNYNSVTWSSAGDGTFDDVNILGATYTPGSADIAAGSVVLTLTAEAISPCAVDASDDMTLSIQGAPTANAGSDADICEGSSHTLSGSATNYNSVTWSTGGDGTFDDINILGATYTPGSGDIAAGSVVLTLTAEAVSPCGTDATDDMTLSIQGVPTANAGSDASVCEGSDYTLSGSATNYNSVTWTTAGDGTFDDINILGATYTPGSADIAAGSVVLTLTAEAVSPCAVDATDDMTLSIQGTPTANAGSDASICEGSDYTLSGSATNYNSVTWSTAGDGTFDDINILGATYTPGSADIAAGSVVLTLTAEAISPCAGDASDDMTLTIQAGPTANAGSDASICEGSDYTLSGSATNYNSVTWSTAGDGTFDDINILGATYTPGSADIAAGSVVLTLTAEAISPCGVDATDDMTLSIQGAPTANAGSDANICEGSDYTLSGSATNQNSVTWSTAGDGTFDDINILGATYTPGSADIAAGSVVLTLTAEAILPCGVDATDDMTLTIEAAATANAGSDDNICSTGTYILSGSATNQTSVLWTTGGDGSFDDATSLTAVYSPGGGDITAGSVVLTLTAYATAPCADATDDMTLTILGAPTADAGPDDDMCSTDSYTLNGSATNQTSVLWTSAGGGTFGDATALSTSYTPSASEITAGSATLTLTAYAAAPCTDASDQIVLTIQGAPTAGAGTDATICEGSTHTLTGTATNQNSVTWSTAGDGTFDDTGILGATYTPGSADIAAGSVVLTLTAEATAPCSVDATDDMTLTIQGAATADAGPDGNMCSTGTYALSGAATNQTSILWTGGGTFGDATALSTTYTPSAAEITAGTATLTLTAYAVAPCLTDATDQIVITIQRAPTVNAGPDDIVDAGSDYTLAGSAADQASVLWTTAGDGTFDDASLLAATYTPGTDDLDDGSVVLTLTAYPNAPCATPASDDMTLFFSYTADVNLTLGWNIMSFYVQPADFDMQAIVQPLIDAGELIKVQDEDGNYVQFIPGPGWSNTIGNMANTEGYYIKVNTNTTLTTEGIYVAFPFDVALSTGWNIAGYPIKVSQDAFTLLNALVTSGSLVKVMDEAGNFIQNIPPYGWLNTIGNFDPDEGYYINVNTPSTLQYTQPTKGTAPADLPEAPKTEHFFSLAGNPFNPMNIVIQDIVANGFQVEDGDEIAVYDGDLEVGSASIHQGYGGYQVIIAAGNDPASPEIDGYTVGNTISFKYWDKSHNMVYDNVQSTHFHGDKEFAALGTFVGELEISALGVSEYDQKAPAYLGQNYPNPFTNNTTINFGLYEDGAVLLSIYDVSGRRIHILEDAVLARGHHSVTFENPSLEPGVYYYKLEFSSNGNIWSETRKMIVH